jgi:hypothetical protein
MSTTSLVILIVAIVAAVLVIAAIAAAVQARRRRALQSQFGSEYDRAVGDADSRRAAERDLLDRTERREQLDIRPLDPASAERYREEWQVTQSRFVDAPAESVAQAHVLVSAVLRERGYPTDDADERMSMLSVDHADVMDRYRAGVDTEQSWRQSGNADTEELRQAMQHYREVFDRVVDTGGADTYPEDSDISPTATRGTRR